MQHTPQQLKDKLLKVLDTDNNVLDMRQVLELISVLETYPITKAILEETRIGKYVNELRKKTQDRDLAKRTKNLVRKWQQLVVAGQGHLVNGDGVASPAGSQGSMPASPALPQYKLSPRLPGSRPDTPLSLSTKSTVSPGLSRPTTPLLAVSGKLPRSVLTSSKPASPSLSAIRNSSALKRTVSSPGLQLHGNGMSTSSSRKRSHVEDNCDVPAKKPNQSDPLSDSVSSVQLKDLPGIPINGLLRGADREDIPSPLDASTPKMGADSLANKRNANLTVRTDIGPMLGMGTPSPLSRTPRSSRVKTTAELVAEMQAKHKALAASEVVSKINKNMIEKEIDPIKESVVPAGAKPRPRKKPGTVVPPTPPNSTLSQTKTEMVEKFLRTSVVPHVDETEVPSPYKADSLDHTESLSMSSEMGHMVSNSHSFIGNDSHPSVRSESPEVSQDRLQTNENLQGAITEYADSVKTEEAEDPEEDVDPYSLLPPIDEESINWDTDTYKAPQEYEVTDEHVDRLVSEHWSGVNGHFDHQGEWQDWTATYSMPSYNGDLIYILPYVSVDD